MNRALRSILAVATMVATVGAWPGLARAASEPTALAASHWRLVHLDGTTIPARAGMTLAFTLSGRVSGSGGCNDFTGTWTHLGGDGIHVGSLAVTRTHCRGDRGRSEERYLDELSLATTFSIDGRELTIGTTDGGSLVFRAGSRSGSELVGDWVLAVVDGEVAADIPRSTVTFDDAGRLSGSGACNGYTGTYAIDDDAIRVGPVSIGRATCPAGAMEQETAFLDALGTAATWSVAGDTLTLTGKGGRHPLTLTPIRPVTYALTETPWTVSEGATASADSTIRFDADGTVSGWAGCNSFRGPWSLDDDGIVLHIGPLLATRAACAPGLMDLETSYLTALEDVIGYKTPHGTSLWLTTASGVRIEYDPPVTPSLTGATWTLVEVLGTPFAELAPVDIHFSDDGTVTGFGGCALYTGSFELRDGALRLQDVVGGGGRDCQQPVSDFEASFLSLLPFVDHMSFDGQDLLLWTGEQPLRFRAQ